MNVFLQIGIGLIPSALIVLILLFKRKAFNIGRIFAVILLLAATGASLYFGVVNFKAEDTKKNLAVMTQSKMLAFANAMLEEGAYDEVSELIKEYSDEYGYDDECRLLAARMATLCEDYDIADGLYSYLCDNTDLVSEDDDEVIFASKMAKADLSAIPMIEYLMENGEKIEDYGYSKDQYNELLELKETDSDDIKKKIYHKIEDKYKISETVSDYARAVADMAKIDLSEIDRIIDEDYEMPADDEDGGHTAKKIKKFKKIFDEMKKKAPEYLELECVSKASTANSVVLGEFEDITKNLDSETSSYHELMIASELYMGEYVKSKNFSKDFKEGNGLDSEIVKEQLSKLYDSNKDGMSKQEKKELKSRINALNDELGDPVLITLKDELTEALTEEAGPDETKVYLELAKIEDYFGNETMTDAYISDAIYSSPECEDKSYAGAMSDIIAVIRNDEDADSENIKNVSSYVDNVMEHSLTVDVEKIISVNETVAENFKKTAVDHVSRAKAAISIGHIDTSSFETINARVQINSKFLAGADELKKAIEVYDCGSRIEDFDLKKIDYTSSNILLLCDISGSMSGSMGDLKGAVTTFVEDINDKENISIVTFDDTIEGSISFGASQEELLAFANSMGSAGGTDMFSATVGCLDNFPNEKGANNVLILMTDGQDNNPKSSDVIYSEIGERAKENGVTIYTMGLGESVDTAYLQTIAASGDGSFIYVADSGRLSGFYDMLHSQVYCQYELTYNAVDKDTKEGRLLEVLLPSENVQDSREYSIGTNKSKGSGLNESQGLTVNSMSPDCACIGISDMQGMLCGSGFKKESNITVKLKGTMTYNLDAKFIDENNYSVTIPSNITEGSYNVEVTIDGKKFTLKNGFTALKTGSLTKSISTEFGPYKFTSDVVKEAGNNTLVLSGHVKMNDWLNFKGDICLVGDLEHDASIEVQDKGGSFVEFSNSSSVGLGKVLASQGVNVSIPKLGNFNIYKELKNTPVDDIRPGALKIFQFIDIDNFSLNLYPDKLSLVNADGSALIEDLYKVFNPEDVKDSWFKIGNVTINSNNVGIKCSAGASNDRKSNVFNKTSFLGCPVWFNGHIKADLDTFANEYEFDTLIRFAFLADDSGLGARIKIVDAEVPNASGNTVHKLVADEAEVKMELGIPVKLPTAVPIEIYDFTVGAKDIADVIKTGNLFNLTLVGKMSFGSVNFEEIAPVVSSMLDVQYVLSMPDTTITLRLNPPRIEADASLCFLDKVQLAKAGIKVGVFDYSNSMLNLPNTSVGGLHESLTLGIAWKSSNERLSMEVTGTGMLDAHTRFMGASYEGITSIVAKWWLINISNEKDMNSIIGVYITSTGEPEFVIGCRKINRWEHEVNKLYVINSKGFQGNQYGKLD